MRNIYILTVVFFFAVGLLSVNAQDMITLRDGSTIQAKVLEINPADIRYKRFDNQNGPTITIPSISVASIKYPNGVVDVINAPSPDGAQWLPAQLQTTLNSLPAVTVAGNSLKFQFDGDKWTALLNGENFLAGITTIEKTERGSLLSLKQTHMWPGAAMKTAGKVAGMVPGGGAVAGAVNTASSVASVAGASGLAPGAVEARGPIIVLEYISSPSPKLSFVRTEKAAGGASGSGEYITLEKGNWEKGDVGGNIKIIEFDINREKIEDREVEVLNATNNFLGQYLPYGLSVFTQDETIIKKLINGSGIRFKAIGDGKTWMLAIITQSGDFYTTTIKTKKNTVVEIDAPYSKIKNGNNAVLTKNQSSIQKLNFQVGAPQQGKTTIKIFDIEVY